jgi:hypothetical protein
VCKAGKGREFMWEYEVIAILSPGVLRAPPDNDLRPHRFDCSHGDYSLTSGESDSYRLQLRAVASESDHL